jgi:hypothetical protein
MKRWMIGAVAVVAIVLGGLMTNSAEAHGRGYYNYGHRSYCGPVHGGYRSYYGGYGPYSSFRPYYGGGLGYGGYGPYSGGGFYYSRPGVSFGFGW